MCKEHQKQPPAVSRRRFLHAAGVGVGVLFLLPGCERHRYIRPGGELDLGAVEDLLYSSVHIRSKAILLFRDADGWAALSTRCTYRGCDLTHQEPVLLCPCCRTRYSLDGIPHQGWPATRPLPWVDLAYREGHIWANPGTVRPPGWRFSTPEIEEAVRKLRLRVREEKLRDEVAIPSGLKGTGDGEAGTMFLEEDPNLIHELKMIK
ncbi:MAG: Rieske 2Fe-2S domain-containing protein [Bdellovibrionales bacterium]|nr:Rieske 2Fe-2S domain-containing protein [Bdellovibrionales bacterium]